MEKRLRWHSSLAKLTFWSFVFLGLIFIFFFLSPSSSSLPSDPSRRSLRTYSWGGPAWEKRVRSSAKVRARNGISVLVTGAAGFVGTHVSAALKRRGDGVVGLDNFNDYYDPSLKRARQALLERTGVFIVEGDINDSELLRKLFEVVAFTHVMHLAAQAGVRLQLCGLLRVQCMDSIQRYPFPREIGRISLPVSMPPPRRLAKRLPILIIIYMAFRLLGCGSLPFMDHGEDLIWRISFSPKDILKGKSIRIFEAPNHGTVARDFTYIDDIVKGCVAALDTAEKSTGSGGKKKGPAQLRVFNLGNTSPVPVTDLVSILERLLKVKAKRTMMKMPRNGDVQFTHANISLAQRELGYKPTTDLQTGLKKFVRWYIKYYSAGEKSAQ
ncbi:UDP-glucuronate 4-epimerase 3 [Vitis vinifera]|uniref:UDP-glucuronate 4-epimerase 3 n=1 Tax=Vitis vinifera TaxID=29760 RepID=A0A438GXE3_VITVI|nr:UDP-glucuronate 4-epimerase 3 [Vitis vinifera]